MLLKFILLLVAYLLGAIPFSIILGKKFRGIDVREHGSGNPGGTNSFRFLGGKIGGWVSFLDGTKAALIPFLITFNVLDGSQLFHPLAYGLAAAVGHVFSVYIRFKGGKAVATTIGAMVAFNIFYALIMIAVFLLILKIWKYVSVASTVAVFSTVIIGLVMTDWSMVLYSSLLFLLVAYRHQSNYKNIINKTESKVSWI